MDSLFLLLFACFIFMLINAFFVALSHLHVRWENKRYERSRWMIVAALLGLSIQYVIQMGAASVLLTTVLGRSSGVQWYLCSHHCGLFRGHQSSSQPVYQRRALYDAGSVLCKCLLLHIHYLFAILSYSLQYQVCKKAILSQTAKYSYHFCSFLGIRLCILY